MTDLPDLTDFSGHLLLDVVFGNDLTMYQESSKYWKYLITLTFKFQIVIILKICILFLSHLSDLPIVKNPIVEVFMTKLPSVSMQMIGQPTERSFLILSQVQLHKIKYIHISIVSLTNGVQNSVVILKLIYYCIMERTR